MVTESSRARCPAARRAGDPGKPDVGLMGVLPGGRDDRRWISGRAPVVDDESSRRSGAPTGSAPNRTDSRCLTSTWGCELGPTRASWTTRECHAADASTAEAEQVRPPARYAPPCPLNSVGDRFGEGILSSRRPSHAPDLREGGPSRVPLEVVIDVRSLRRWSAGVAAVALMVGEPRPRPRPMAPRARAPRPQKSSAVEVH